MKHLPHKRRRSRKPSTRSKRRSARDLKKCAVEPPEIGVKVQDRSWNGHRYAPAKIRIRNGCYRYLVWRDGLVKREFYLGKIKILTPRFPRAEPAAAPAPGGAAGDIAGVQK